jgi:hypothetical protein
MAAQLQEIVEVGGEAKAGAEEGGLVRLGGAALIQLLAVFRAGRPIDEQQQGVGVERWNDDQ